MISTTRVKVVYGDVKLIVPIYDDSIKVAELGEYLGAIIGNHLGTEPVKIAVIKTSDSFTFRSEDTLSYVLRSDDILHLVNYKEYIEEQYKFSFFSFYIFSYPGKIPNSMNLNFILYLAH